MSGYTDMHSRRIHYVLTHCCIVQDQQLAQLQAQAGAKQVFIASLRSKVTAVENEVHELKARLQQR